MKSILLIVLSSFFLHPTSIVYFIIFPIRYLSRRPSFLSGLSILSIISSFFVKNYMYLLFALFPSFSRYQFNRFGQGIQFKGQIIIWVIEVLLIFYLLRLIKEESINLNEQRTIYAFYFLLLNVLVGILSTELTIFYRFSLYFEVHLIWVIPLIIKSFKKQERLFITYLVVLLMGAYYIYLLSKNIGEIIPYQLLNI